MEIDLINDILTSTVGQLFKGQSSFTYKQGNQQFDKTISKNENEYMNSYNVSNDAYSNFSSVLAQSQLNNFNNKTLKADQAQNINYFNNLNSNNNNKNINQQQLQNNNNNKNNNLENYLQNKGQELLKNSLNNLKLDINKINKISKELDQYDSNLINEQKKRVKKELKNYDQQFQILFGRMPNRNEKEPMRPLYIYYKKLKQQLDKEQSQSNQKINNNNNLKVQGSQLQQNYKQMSQQQLINLLQELKKTRNNLRDILHNYQQEFTKTNNRKIRYQKDIQVVEKEYNDYKEIKLQIQDLENVLSQKNS